MTLFIIRHLLRVRFEADKLVIQPALYPGSPPIIANLRIRSGRLRLEIDGSGPIKDAIVNGKKIMPGADGALQLDKVPCMDPLLLKPISISCYPDKTET